MRRATLILAAFLVSWCGAPRVSAQDDAEPVTLPLLGGQQVDLSTSSPVALIRTDSFQCTGVLVGSRQVLTAAHCLFGAGLPEYQITLGGRTYGAADAFVPSGYRADDSEIANLENSVFDIGMLILEESVSSPAPAALLRDLPLAAGDRAAIFGYGSTEYSSLPGVTAAERAKGANVVINSTMRGLFSTLQTSSGASSCAGDSGGPAVKIVQGYPAVIGIIVAGTNGTSGGGCVLRAGGESLYVDLQSAEAIGFLKSFPVVTTTKSILEYNEFIDEARTFASRALTRTAIARLRSDMKAAEERLANARAIVTGRRKSLADRALGAAANSRVSRQFTRAKKRVMRVLEAVDTALALGIAS